MTALLMALISVVLAGAAAPGRHRRLVARRRQRTVSAALADVVDLMVVMLGAGFEVADAIGWLAGRGPRSVSAGFTAVMEASERGQPLTTAMRSLEDVLGPEYRPLVATLTSAVRDGAPTSSLLLRLGDEARSARRREQERAARSLPVQLLFPLVCCSLPAVVVGAVVPVALVAIGRL